MKKELKLCEVCNTKKHANEVSLRRYDDKAKYLCETCQENSLTCFICQNFYSVDEHSLYNGDAICATCYLGNCADCSSCGETHYQDDIHVCNECDDYLCNACRGDHYHEDYDRGSWVEDAKRDCRFLKKNVSDQEGKIIKSKRLFGVEIETVNNSDMERKEFDKFVSSLPREIGMCYDGSIDDAQLGIELQTPPASGQAGEALLAETVGLLKNHNFKVNYSCGLHIHIDGNDFLISDKPLQRENIDNVDSLVQTIENNSTAIETAPQTLRFSLSNNEEYEEAKRLQSLKSLFMFYVTFEDLIVSFLPKSRRLNRYCKLLQTEISLRQVHRCTDENELVRLWYGTSDDDEIRRKKGHKYDDSRYYGVNFHSLFSSGHLEIRYHSGTVNIEKMLHWLNLHLRIVDLARSGDLPNHIGEYASLAVDTNMETKLKSLAKLLKLDDKSYKYFEGRLKKFNAINDSGKIVEEE